MLKVFFLLFISSSFTLFSQKESVIINLPETNLLFSGYDNLVVLSFSNKKIKNLTLVCDSCDTIKILKENLWVILVNSAPSIILKAIDKKGKVHGQTFFKVQKPPKPTLNLDDKNSEATIKSLPFKLSLKHDSSVPLVISYLITKWKVKIDEKEFSGMGNEISKDLQDYMMNVKKGVIIFEINYKSALGDEKLKEIFEFNLN